MAAAPIADHVGLLPVGLPAMHQPALMPQLLQPGIMLQAVPQQFLQQQLLLQQSMMLQMQQQQQRPLMQPQLLLQPQQAPTAVPLSSALSALNKLDAATHTQLLQQILQQHPETRSLVTQRHEAEQSKPVDLKHFVSAAWHALHQLDRERPSRQFSQSHRVSEDLGAVIREAAALPSPK
jgi:hypothetical protein